MTPTFDRRQILGLLAASTALGVASRLSSAATPLQTAASTSALHLPAGATIRRRAQLLSRRSRSQRHHADRETRRLRRVRSGNRGTRTRRQEGCDDPRVSRCRCYEDRLLLSADYNFTARSIARPGYAVTLTRFAPKLRQAGVSEEVLRRMTIDNPRRFLAFVAMA